VNRIGRSSSAEFRLRGPVFAGFLSVKLKVLPEAVSPAAGACTTLVHMALLTVHAGVVVPVTGTKQMMKWVATGRKTIPLARNCPQVAVKVGGFLTLAS
jgi:hypothetical protein